MTALLAILLSLIFPPCATEDSSLCTWSASEQGNGTGQSFIALTGDAVIYLP